MILFFFKKTSLPYKTTEKLGEYKYCFPNKPIAADSFLRPRICSEHYYYYYYRVHEPKKKMRRISETR